MLAERGPLRVGLTAVTLLLGFLMLVQTVVARLVSGSPGADEVAALGAIMALPWLLSAMLVGPAPRYAAMLLCLAGIVGVADRAAPLDLRVWGGIAFFLALLCLGASMADGRAVSRAVPAVGIVPPGPVVVPERASVTSQQPMPSAPSVGQAACPVCGAENAPAARFCYACGVAMAGPGRSPTRDAASRSPAD